MTKSPSIGRRALLAAAPFIAGTAHAQTAPWPNRPVRILVGFPPGGPTDFVARLIAPGLAAAWQQQVIIENRGGANGTIATDAVAKSAPDGHTLLFSGNNIVMNTALYRLPYDMISDFAPVGMVAFSPNVLWAGPNSPLVTLDDVVRAARAQPGVLSYASTGNGGNGHFGGETLKRALGIDITHVPYRGTAPALQDVLAGRVPLFMQTIVGAIGPYLNGQLRPIVAFGRNRVTEIPHTPTLADLGYDVPDSGTWYGVLVAAGTPTALIERMARDLEAVTRSPSFRERLAAQATVPDWLGPAGFAGRIREEVPAWAQVARAANMRAE
ncbi:MAG: LacI family transcriptional regulator [Rhodospirillales bacterium]|jgi:tripartite-type tricarboxylate transporter receptor subunit TctC|nr:LacI family transcriptional regulator [Rhodospirillales bacterium]